MAISRLAPGEVESLKIESVQMRLVALQSEYDHHRAHKEMAPDWVLSDIFACKNEIEKRGAPIPDFVPEKRSEPEEPEWLRKVKAERQGKIKAAPF